jgi:hypothetical protein
MRSTASLALGSLTLMTLTTGCRGMLFPLLLATRIGVAVAVATSHPRVVVVESPEPVVLAPEVYYSAPPPPPPRPDLPPPPAPGASGGPVQRFDVTAAHAELDAIDPSECWPPGAVQGYGKARITFAPAGTVQLVELTNPVHGAPPDGACIAQKYGSAAVPPFGGSSVAVTTTFYVR